MRKIFHSLRFQLPAVVTGVFLGILCLLMLFFHEMTKILVKTRQLAQSAEVNDYVANWINILSSSARERTKLMSLGDETYLRTFQVSLNEINDLYREIENICPDSTAQSTVELRGLHDTHLEYLELLDGFAKDQTSRMQQLRSQVQQAALKATMPRKLDAKRKPLRALAGGGSPRKKGLAASKRSLAQTSNALGKKSGGRVSKRATRLADRSNPQVSPAVLAAAKQIELDTATNETFKSYEQGLREGLFHVQETMRAERRDKLISLRNSVGRAKDRLIYSLLLLLAMVAYVAVILKWKILDPMKNLKQGAMEIGKGSLGYQVEVHSRNEIGELAEVFNKMSVQLDHKQNAEVKVKRLEAIEQVVRSVNHEINNPLMIISGNAEYLLAIMENGDAGVKSKLESILFEVRRIFTVTQRLKEIKEPVTESYIGGPDQMIDIIRSSQVRRKDW